MDPTISTSLATTRARAGFLVALVAASILGGVLFMTPGTSAIYADEAQAATTDQIAHVAYLSGHTGMHSDLTAIPATGPVRFWDGSAVMCSALLVSADGSGDPSSLVSQGDFSCDWSTLVKHPASVDGAFQKQLDVRVGLVKGARAASARIPAAVPWFATSVQPAE